MAILLFVLFTFYFILIVFFVLCHWKIFVKAGKPGWACIIPIYSTIVLLEIIKKPTIWFLYLIIPFVNIVFLFKINIELAKVFGKDTAYGIGLALIPMIFLPMLAFGDAHYLNDETNYDDFGKPVANPNFENQV